MKALVLSADVLERGLAREIRGVDPYREQANPIPLRWHVAERADGKPVESGSAEARPARDFTVKVEPRRLKPGRDYHYWFELADGVRSPAGRFRTLPEGKTADAVMAVVSCQLYPGGFFTAYDSIAALERIDAVVVATAASNASS